jgi:5-oxoprolinase (ATP-hydrolysing) subunit C
MGLSANGASDAGAATVANLLVGNEPAAPLVEVTASAFSFTALSPLLFAVTGATEALRVEGEAQPLASPLAVGPGESVELAAPRAGVRSYLALNGDLLAPRLLGSVAPDRLLGFGSRLGRGDRIALLSRFDESAHSPGQVLPPWAAAESGVLPEEAIVEVTPGPEIDQFEAARERLDGAVFEVSPNSDAMGLRLEGEPLRRRTTAELLSRGVPVGAVEVPPRGPLLALLRGRYVTAGYPVAAVATRTAIDVLAQLRVGQRVRLRLTTTERAIRMLARRRERLAEIDRRVRAAFFFAGIAHCLSRSRSLESPRHHVTD